MSMTQSHSDRTRKEGGEAAEWGRSEGRDGSIMRQKGMEDGPREKCLSLAP